jgi:hypothetical protein
MEPSFHMRLRLVGTNRAAVLLVLLVSALAMIGLSAAGCGSTGATTTSIATTTSFYATTTSAPLSGMTPEQKTYTELIKVSANAARELAKKLEAEGFTETDPRAALLLGLRARTQVASSRKFIGDKDLQNADVAYREARSYLARAAVYADAETAAALKAAADRFAALPSPPSQDTAGVAAALDLAISDLAGLVGMAEKETGVSATPTTT